MHYLRVQVVHAGTNAHINKLYNCARIREMLFQTNRLYDGHAETIAHFVGSLIENYTFKWLQLKKIDQILQWSLWYHIRQLHSHSATKLSHLHRCVVHIGTKILPSVVHERTPIFPSSQKLCFLQLISMTVLFTTSGLFQSTVPSTVYFFTLFASSDSTHSEFAWLASWFDGECHLTCTKVPQHSFLTILSPYFPLWDAH